MNSKFLYFRKRQTFDNLVATFPEGLSPICFIEDTNEIWFNNHFFQAGHETLMVSEMNNNVIVSLADSYFTIVPGSSSIALHAQDNTIMISCDALTRIDTDDYLEWKNDRLYHKDSGVEAGGYGPTANQTGANTFKVPRLVVDKKGHITNASERDITIRDFVEQRKSDDVDADRPILISENQQDRDNTDVTRKGKQVTYNNFTKTLKVPKVEVTGGDESLKVKGNLVVEQGTIIGKLQGEVTGTATPKIHLSENPDYGGASTELYGHVKLVDQMPATPQPSSSNADKNNQQVEAKAASPYLVYNYVKAQKIKINAIDANKHTIDVSDRLDFTDDFVIKNNQLSISWTEL